VSEGHTLGLSLGTRLGDIDGINVGFMEDGAGVGATVFTKETLDGMWIT
jgi:hypothetical protein